MEQSQKPHGGLIYAVAAFSDLWNMVICLKALLLILVGTRCALSPLWEERSTCYGRWYLKEDRLFKYSQLISREEDTIASGFQNTFLCSKCDDKYICDLSETQSRPTDFAIKETLKPYFSLETTNN